MKRFIIGFLIIGVFGCSGGADSETEPDNSTLEETIQEDSLSEEELFSNPILLPSIPDTLITLVEVFNLDASMNEEELLACLHLDEDDAPFGLIPEDMFTTPNGFVFLSSTPLGATSLYAFRDYIFSFFDTAGEYQDKISISTTDSNVEIGCIQNEFIFVKNVYKGSTTDEETEMPIFTDESILELNYLHTFPLTIRNVKDADPNDWPIYRNSIYAKHGYIFKTDKYSEHFSNFDWYEPSLESVDHLLSPAEKEFADYLLALEAEKK